jgi:putative spermidine/putrescine transport system permease protein
MRARLTPWNIFWLLAAAVYFLLPLYGTAQYSLETTPGHYSFDAYKQVLQDPAFKDSFLFSLKLAIATVLIGEILMVPTVYWVNLRLPRFRPVLDFVSVLPFVVPPITLIVGILHVFQNVSIVSTADFHVIPAGSQILVFSYAILALPFIYRSLDAGMRAIKLQTLTEAAQSVGAGWLTVMIRVILPNLRFAILSGAFLTVTLVMGEFTMASIALVGNTFPVYIQYIGSTETHPSGALAIISFGLTWLAMLGILFIGRGAGRQQAQVGGAR